MKLMDVQSLPLNTQPIEPKKNLEAYQALLAVDAQERNINSQEGYVRAYIMSVLLPPVGIYYWVKYLFFKGGSAEDIKAGFTCLILTIVSIVVSTWIVTGMFKQLLPANSSGSIDSLKEMTSPASVKEIIKLYQ